VDCRTRLSLNLGAQRIALRISADLNWMDYLGKAKLIRTETRHNLLGNARVLIDSADASTNLTIAPLFDLAGATGNGKIAVRTIAARPGRIYAKQALETLGVWAKVEPKLAQADNIRNALNLVSRGEAKFGIVYASGSSMRQTPRPIPRRKWSGFFPNQRIARLSTRPPLLTPRQIRMRLAFSLICRHRQQTRSGRTRFCNLDEVKRGAIAANGKCAARNFMISFATNAS
jgi:ABC-type molybdate transport system substrate-binding protein